MHVTTYIFTHLIKLKIWLSCDPEKFFLGTIFLFARFYFYLLDSLQNTSLCAWFYSCLCTCVLGSKFSIIVTTTFAFCSHFKGAFQKTFCLLVSSVQILCYHLSDLLAFMNLLKGRCTKITLCCMTFLLSRSFVYML